MGLIYSFCFLLLLFIFKLISDYLFLGIYTKNYSRVLVYLMQTEEGRGCLAIGLSFYLLISKIYRRM